MEIKRASVEDSHEIFKLQRLAFQIQAEIYNNYNIPPLTQTLEELEEVFLHKTFLKVVYNNKIVGSVRAYMNEGRCIIGKLIVHPDFQNQGIGTKLMNEIEAIFNKAKIYELFTGHKSKKNLYLYQKLGYKEIKKEKINDKLTYVYLEKLNKKV